MAAGARAAGADAIEIPVADGGEGTLDALVAGAGGTIMGVIARGPLGVPVRAHLGRLRDGTGVVEMAQASGLALVPEKERDVMRASSQGTGELIKGALARRPETVVVGLGDSATCDGGMGLAKGLGVAFVDDAGRPLPDGGGALERLARIDASRLDARLQAVKVVVAADVQSSLLGPGGAAPAFAAQKGATPSDIEALERGLRALAERMRRDLDADVAEIAGSGAAGGCGAMLAALGAEIRPGASLVLDVLGFDERVAGADLVITGEGRIDEQTMRGKAPHAVLQAARRAGIRCAAIAGAVDADAGFDATRALADHPAQEGEPLLAHLERVARRFVAELLRA